MTLQLQIEGVASVAAADMPEPPSDDQQLFRAMSRGDETAFARLYDLHQGPIYRFALHMTGSVAIAEEVTQEVFMQLIKNPKAYKATRGSLTAYLFGAARNLARRATKQNSPGVPLNDLEETVFILSADPDALEKLTHSETLVLLRNALLGLPENYREAVVLCDLEEMDYGQAAAILECSSGTIASRLHRAHAILRARLSRAMGTKPCLT